MSVPSSVVDVAHKVYIGLDIAVAGGGAAFDVYESAKDRSLTASQKTLRIGADILCVGAQGARTAVELFNCGSSGTRVFTTVFAGGANLLRTISRFICQREISWEQWGDLAAQAVESAADAVDSLLKEFPVPYGSKIRLVVNAVRLAAVAIRNRQAIRVEGQLVWSMVVNLVGSDESAPSKVEIRFRVDDDDVLAMGEEFAAQLREVTDAATIEDLPRVPEVFIGDEILSPFCCPITRRPIRFPVRPVGRSERSVSYERGAVERLLQENPQARPPGWPEGLAITPENLIPDQKRQEIINERLVFLHERIRKRRIEPKRTIVELAQQLSIVEGQTDAAICARISANPRLADLVARIWVQSRYHVFAGARLPQRARAINIVCRRVIMPGMYRSDLEKAAKAVLGSTDESDVFALEVIAKNGHCFWICFSKDLHFCSIGVFTSQKVKEGFVENPAAGPQINPLTNDNPALVAKAIAHNARISKLIYSVVVRRVYYLFEGMDRSVQTKEVCVSFPVHDSSKKRPEVEKLTAAGRAVLGSTLPEDLNALSQIALTTTNILIHSSMDGTLLVVNFGENKGGP